MKKILTNAKNQQKTASLKILIIDFIEILWQQNKGIISS